MQGRHNPSPPTAPRAIWRDRQAPEPPEKPAPQGVDPLVFHPCRASPPCRGRPPCNAVSLSAPLLSHKVAPNVIKRCRRFNHRKKGQVAVLREIGKASGRERECQ